MSKKVNDVSWEDVLSAASRLQLILPEAVVVGGTAASLIAQHRISFDADHVLVDLRANFNQVLERLESEAGWNTNRLRPPVLILGSFHGIETGIRQLIRSRPLETMTVDFKGQSIQVPTPAEILRIKAALILRRNAMRDYVDFAALSDKLFPELYDIFKAFDDLYPQPNGNSSLQQLQIQLSNPMPYDRDEVSLPNFKNLDEKWHDWEKIVGQCRTAAKELFNSWPPKAGPKTQISTD